MFKLLALFGVIYMAYRYSDIIHKLTGPKTKKIDKDDFTDYEEIE